MHRGAFLCQDLKACSLEALSRPSRGHTVNIIVPKQAIPPTKLEMGSARKTPVVPSPATVGSHRVSGMTMTALRSREKKMACLE